MHNMYFYVSIVDRIAHTHSESIHKDLTAFNCILRTFEFLLLRSFIVGYSSYLIPFFAKYDTLEMRNNAIL